MSVPVTPITEFDPSRLPENGKSQIAVSVSDMGAPCTLPVLAVRGRWSGPMIVVAAGVHGDEYEGPAAIRRVFDRLDCGTLSGTFVGLPRLNPAAFAAGTRKSPESLDGLDLNRCWPGKPASAGGRPTEILAASLWPVLAAADLLIDLHAGGADYEFSKLTGFADVRNPAREAGRRAAGAFGGDALWRMPRTDGILIWEFAHRLEKPALAAETAGRGGCDPAEVERFAAGVENVLRLQGMLPGAAPDPADLPVMDTIYQEMPAEGLFIPAVRVGQRVAADGLLGNICDDFGVPIAAATAMFEGRVLALRWRGRVTTADWLCCLGLPA